MSLRLVLAASTVLVFAGPAFARQVPPAPPAPAEAPAEIPPVQAAAIARVQTAGEALKTVMEELEPQAAAIRADAALSPEDKETRIRALLAPHQAKLDEFVAAITDMVAFETADEGASPEEIAEASTMIGPMIMAEITQALITGETGEEDEGQ
jgi:hypothetical protein